MRQKFHPRRPREPQITPPGGSGEQIVPQRERAEHAALHAVQNSGEIAGAEDGGSGGEFRYGSAGGGGRREVAGMGDKNREDMKNSPDTPRNGAGLRAGRGGCGCSGHRVGVSRVKGTKQEIYD